MNSHYLKFEEFFVKPIFFLFGEPLQGSFSEDVKKFLRPHEHKNPKVNHNWGDWYSCQNFTFVRCYGFEGYPYVLPKPAPDRIAFLEILRKLSVSNAKHFGGAHKQAFLPSTLHFQDLKVVSTKAYEVIERKLVDEYNLFQHISRMHYDPEGYIHASRKRQELGNYFHQEDESNDMCRNKEVEELVDVMETLEKKLEERRQRLENMEEEPAQSDLGENEVVSKLRAPNKEKDLEAQDKLTIALNAEIDERMIENVSFVSDDQFIKSKEFKSFLYHLKGKKLREAVPNITPENEAEMKKRLKEDIDAEVETMTPQKGRQVLVEAGIIVFPGWDLSASFIFDSLLNSDNKDMKLNIQGVKYIFIGSRYDPNEEEMLLWALYPPKKRPKIIDVDKAFGHMMTLKVGEVDPMITADIGINVSKFNKAQMKHEIVEKNKYKALYEETLKRSGHPIPQITNSRGQWKKKFEKLAYEHTKLKREMKSIRVDTASVC